MSDPRIHQRSGFTNVCQSQAIADQTHSAACEAASPCIKELTRPWEEVSPQKSIEWNSSVHVIHAISSGTGGERGTGGSTGGHLRTKNCFAIQSCGTYPQITWTVPPQTCGPSFSPAPPDDAPSVPTHPAGPGAVPSVVLPMLEWSSGVATARQHAKPGLGRPTTPHVWRLPSVPC